MQTLSARSVPLTALPIIDIGALRLGSDADGARVVDQIGAACRDKGFFYIANHGVPDSLIDAVFAQAREFFTRPLDEKLAVGRDDADMPRGYEPMGFQTLDQGTAPDAKEAYDIGAEGHAANRWPPNQPAFAATMTDYFTRMMALSRVLLSGLGRSLGLDDGYFNEFCQDPMAILRPIHYPQQPVRLDAQEIGAGAHTDWGALTLLLQDDCGGLQVWDQDGGWMHVTPVPGTFVVNIGDLMARWTNDHYRSTVHRVVNLSGRDRYSVPFFLDGNADYVVACLPGCSGPDDPAKYPPVSVLGHVDEMHRRALTGAAREGTS